LPPKVVVDYGFLNDFSNIRSLSSRNDNYRVSLADQRLVDCLEDQGYCVERINWDSDIILNFD
jgi:hypothetical protein